MRLNIPLESKPSSKAQVERVSILTAEACRDAFFSELRSATDQQLQALHSHGGELKDQFSKLLKSKLDFGDFIDEFIEKYQFVVKPKPASQLKNRNSIGPVVSDEVDSPVDLRTLVFKKVVSSNESISFATLLERCRELRAVGSYGMVKILNDYQNRGQCLIPKNVGFPRPGQFWGYLVFPFTIFKQDGEKVITTFEKELDTDGYSVIIRPTSGMFHEGAYVLTASE